MAKKADHVEAGNLSDAELKRKILEAKLRKEEVMAQKAEFALKVDAGVYVPKEEFYGELAARVFAFDSQVKAEVKAKIRDIIKICNGNFKKASEVQAILISAIETALGTMGDYQTWEVSCIGDDAKGTVKDQKQKRRDNKKNKKTMERGSRKRKSKF